MVRFRMRRYIVVTALCGIATLVPAPSALAHANLSPPVVKAKEGQVFTLAVPTEKETAKTTKIELTPPEGFSIDSFSESPGWKRQVQQTGSGEDAVIQKVTWSGGSIPAGESAFFQFLARPDASKAYAFNVRQTYSDGTVVDWTGPESSDTPAPTIEAKSSFGSGSSSTLDIVALIVAGVAALLGLIAVLGGARRPLS